MLSTVAHFGPNNSLLWGAILCSAEGLAATHEMQVAQHPSPHQLTTKDLFGHCQMHPERKRKVPS